MIETRISDAGIDVRVGEKGTWHRIYAGDDVLSVEARNTTLSGLDAHNTMIFYVKLKNCEEEINIHALIEGSEITVTGWH